MELLATAVLLVHLTWIGLVIFGAFWTRGRPFWTALHLLALCWGIVVEVGPWPCPLTLLETFFETRAGLQPYGGSFLLHCLDSTVYPNLPSWPVTVFAVAVCAVNLGIYTWRLRIWLHHHALSGPG